MWGFLKTGKYQVHRKDCIVLSALKGSTVGGQGVERNPMRKPSDCDLWDPGLRGSHNLAMGLGKWLL